MNNHTVSQALTQLISRSTNSVALTRLICPEKSIRTKENPVRLHIVWGFLYHEIEDVSSGRGNKFYVYR